MLIESKYKALIHTICVENKLSIIFSEIQLGEKSYLHITYGGIFLKPILTEKGIKYYEA